MDSHNIDEANEQETHNDDTVSGCGSLLGDLEPDDGDPSAMFLGAVNSGNLIGFSQESVLQSLFKKERIDIVPNITRMPVLENHNYKGYDFQVLMTEKGPWMYSSKLNKIFIKMRKCLNLEIVFKPEMPAEQLFARSFLCFRSDVGAEVKRCQNHISIDTEIDEMLRQRFLRCDNPLAIYEGIEDGKFIGWRYSIKLPLNLQVRDDGTVRQTILYKFTCQNSCFGRKDLCFVICLEALSGTILGQRVLNVKVCSCPKRDFNIEENSKNNKLLENSENDNTKSPLSRRQSFKEDTGQNCSAEGNVNITKNSNGTYQLLVDCTSKQQAVRLIEGMFEKVAADVLRYPKSNQELITMANKLDQLKDRANQL